MGVNKVRNVSELRNSEHKPVFEVTIKQDGKTIYQEQSIAGVVCSVEKIQKETLLEVEGVTQRLVWGHPKISVFAFDQLHNTMQKTLKELQKIMFVNNKTN